MKTKNNSSAGGIGLIVLMAIMFITLKLTGVIGWSWWWVLSPLWIPASFVAAVIIASLFILAVKEVTKNTGLRMAEKERTRNIDAQARAYGLERQPGETNESMKRRIAFMRQQQRKEEHK